MGAVSQILQFLGLPASIAIVFSAIYGSFAWLENLLSSSAKLALTSFLRSTDWKVWSKRIAAVVQESFNALFGPKHLSGKCIIRSIEFSLSSIFILLILGFLNHYSYFRTMPFELTKTSYRIIFFGWLGWSICIDYFNLGKTRLLIKIIQHTRLSLLVCLLLIPIDLVLSFLVFHFSYEFLDALNMTYQMCEGYHCSLWYFLSTAYSIHQVVIWNVYLWARHFLMISWGPIDNEIAVFFWAGLLPTLWLLVYVLATALTRLIARFSNQIRFILVGLDIDRHPIRSIGLVAATLISASLTFYSLAMRII